MNIKEGDVFRWYYKNDQEYREKNRTTAYWRMDNQCVAINRDDCIYLVDTYWCGLEPKLIGQNDTVLDSEKVDLEFICNTNDVIGLHSWEVEDYDVVYNLSYQKGCYKEYATDAEAYKKGPSKTAVLKKLEGQLQRAHEDLRSAEWTIKRINEQIEELNK